MAPEVVYEGNQFAPEDVADLEHWVLEMNSEEGGVTLAKLRKRFLDEKNIKVRYHVIRKALMRLGYRWGSAKKLGRIKKFATRTARIRQYLLEFSEALNLEENGDDEGNEYVIVYMDESYIHQRHTTGRTWGKPGERIIRTGGGKGSRCIILHGITKDGLLYKKGEQRITDDSADIEKERCSAEWVFNGPVKKGDYHRNMNETNFYKWVTLRLIPSFKKVYPGKRMILVMDNAPYHHIRDENYIDPLQLKREGLFNELILTAGKRSITVHRKGTDKGMDLMDLRHTKKGTQRAPYNKELRDELTKYLKAHPEHQKDKLETLFSKENWKIIYTPPYTPALQPIELLWAEVKRRVANRFTYGRTMNQTRLQMLDAFYGIEELQAHPAETNEEKKARLGVTPELVKSYIDHSIKACKEFIGADKLLVGTIRDINAVRHTNQDMSEEDNDVLNEPEDIRDETDMFFGFEPLDNEEEGASEDVEGEDSAIDILNAVDDSESDDE